MKVSEIKSLAISAVKVKVQLRSVFAIIAATSWNTTAAVL